MNKYGNILKIVTKNICLKDLQQIEEWLANFVNEMKAETIKSIS